MLKKLKNLYKSFSLRAGLIVFIIVSFTLLSVRIYAFYTAIQDQQDEIKNTINAYHHEINEQYNKFGPDAVAKSIDNFTREMHSSNLILVFQQDDEFYGSYDKFPELPLKNNEWFSFKIKRFDAINKVYIIKNYLARIVIYDEMENLIVAYDTEKIDVQKQMLPKILLQYTAISVVASLIISFAVILLLNKYLHRFNLAYSTIKKGNLNYRIKTNNSNDQFDILSQNFNSLMEWVATLLSTIKETTNNLAHDLRTPLSRHRLNLESVLYHEDLPKKAQEDIQNSIAEIDKVIKIFNNILSIAKAESKSGVENFTEFSLNDLIIDLTDLFEPLIEEKKQAINIIIPEKNIKYTGEPKLLTQAIYNLIDNAIKYNKPEGTISIELSQINNDKNIEITISDEGAGIPQELSEKVKEKFYRLDASRTTEGLGLGLSLVDSVIKLHNGKFDITNKTNEMGSVIGLTTKIIL